MLVDGAVCATDVQIAAGATLTVPCGFHGRTVRVTVPRVEWVQVRAICRTDAQHASLSFKAL